MTRLFLLLRDAILSEVLWQQTRWHVMRGDQHRRAARRHADRMRECGTRALALGERTP